MAAALIRNVRIVNRGIQEGGLLIEDGKIVRKVSPEFMPEGVRTVDGGGAYLCPGLIEMHTHGAGGHDFMDGTDEAYDGACEMHLRHGVTTLLPTTVAARDEEYCATIDAFRRAKDRRKERQCLLGLHFEGPYFPVPRAGGMDLRYIRDPEPEQYLKLMEYGAGCIARWTAAPELPGAEQFAEACIKNGILPSIGHTDATIRDVRRAMEAGFRHVTHLYSDMSTITRESGFRVLGVLESAYYLEDLWVEIISDGCHLPPDLLKLIIRLIGTDRLQMCSDSIRPAGTNEREVIVGSLENGVRGIVEDGVAKMEDRSAFLGSVKLGLELVATVHEKAELSLPEAVRMMTENPARILGLHHKGRLDPGCDADLVLFDDEMNVREVWYGGSRVI